MAKTTAKPMFASQDEETAAKNDLASALESGGVAAAGPLAGIFTALLLQIGKAALPIVLDWLSKLKAESNPTAGT